MTISTFSRIPEPELMNEAEQVDAYASADFSESHDRLIKKVGELLNGIEFDGAVLNLGCGSGDDTFRFLNRFPKSSIIAVDGAQIMIDRAQRDLQAHHSKLTERVEFLVAYVPSVDIPTKSYVGIFSNSLLHHMHDPLKFWECVAQHSSTGTPIFVADLRRPASLNVVDQLVAAHAEGAPPILQEDFRNSLKASFTADEILEQLEYAGIQGLNVDSVGDRHIVIYGIRG